MNASKPANAPLLAEGRLGPRTTLNRLIRAGTSETMAGPAGEVTEPLLAFYERLAASGIGTIFTGHLYCHPRGKYAPRQTGIYEDRLIPGLASLAATVKRHGGLVLAQIAHAGSQSRVGAVDDLLAPSAVPNALTGRPVPAATEAEIGEAVTAFAKARAGPSRPASTGCTSTPPTGT